LFARLTRAAVWTSAADRTRAEQVARPKIATAERVMRDDLRRCSVHVARIAAADQVRREVRGAHRGRLQQHI
jgi:hypothetical protein